jgi:branched-chain amino acid transport system substrate-binding protein
VQVVVRDSQSNPNRAGEVAADLILKEKIDIMAVGNTPETANPVSDQCELNGVPCVSSLCPWQPWFFGRKGDPAKGFTWTYHFFWGLEDIIAVFLNLWNSVPTNKAVGGLFPNDGDGNAWGDPQRGLPPALAKDGYKLIDPGRFQNLSQDFSAQIAAFKKDNVEIVTGVVIPPDMKTFWTQARQQGFRPKVVTVGKALLFPAAIEALGELGDGMSTEGVVDAQPSLQVLAHGAERRPARCRLRGRDQEAVDPAHRLRARALRGGHRHAQARQGPGRQGRHPRRPRRTDLRTIVGPVAWGKGPVKNVTRTPLVGGQWVRGKKYKYELVVVDNRTAPEVPTGGKLKLLG